MCVLHQNFWELNAQKTTQTKEIYTRPCGQKRQDLASKILCLFPNLAKKLNAPADAKHTINFNCNIVSPCAGVYQNIKLSN